MFVDYCVVVVVVLLEVVEVDPVCDETFPGITNLQMALQVSCYSSDQICQFSLTRLETKPA